MCSSVGVYAGASDLPNEPLASFSPGRRLAEAVSWDLPLAAQKRLKNKKLAKVFFSCPLFCFFKSSSSSPRNPLSRGKYQVILLKR